MRRLWKLPLSTGQLIQYYHNIDFAFEIFLMARQIDGFTLTFIFRTNTVVLVMELNPWCMGVSLFQRNLITMCYMVIGCRETPHPIYPHLFRKPLFPLLRLSVGLSLSPRFEDDLCREEVSMCFASRRHRCWCRNRIPYEECIRQCYLSVGELKACRRFWRHRRMGVHFTIGGG